MNKVILIKANKGGVGKSWITLQLAHALALKNKKVLVITSDSQNNILDFAGVETDAPLGLDEWLKNGDGGFIELRDNLNYIPFHSSVLSEDLEVRFESFINAMKKEYDYIFIDSTPVLNLDKKFIELADEVVIPTFLDQVTLGSIAILMDQIKPKSKVKAIIPNRAGRTKLEKDYYSKLMEFVSNRILLTIPIKQSAFVSKVIDQGKTIWEYKSREAAVLQKLLSEVLEVL